MLPLARAHSPLPPVLCASQAVASGCPCANHSRLKVPIPQDIERWVGLAGDFLGSRCACGSKPSTSPTWHALLACCAAAARISILQACVGGPGGDDRGIPWKASETCQTTRVVTTRKGDLLLPLPGAVTLGHGTCMHESTAI